MLTVQSRVLLAHKVTSAQRDPLVQIRQLSARRVPQEKLDQLVVKAILVPLDHKAFKVNKACREMLARQDPLEIKAKLDPRDPRAVKATLAQLDHKAKLARQEVKAQLATTAQLDRKAYKAILEILDPLAHRVKLAQRDLRATLALLVQQGQTQQ